MSADVIEIAAKAVQLYAETHPRPPHVNMTQAAEMLNISTSTVRRMMRFGTLKANQCGLIPISQIDLAIATKDAA